MDRRRYELATLAAARHLRSSYCMLQHSSVLLDMFMSADELEAVAADHRDAGLDPVDVAVMDFAEKVAVDATGVTQEDVDGLRAHGLTDAEVSTSCSPPRRARSSARRWTASVPSPTRRAARRSRPSCATR